MTATRQLKRYPINTYHQSESLLLQFVLSEFLLVYREVQCMHILYEHLQSVATKSNSKQLRMDSFNSFMDSLEKLSGASHDTMRLFSWGQDNGLIHKLNTYTTMIFRNCSPENKLKKSLYQQVNQSLLVSLQLHDLAFTVREQPTSHWKDFLQEMTILENKLNNHIDRFAKLLPKYITQFSDDENVIFYILRHHPEFDQLFHKGFVKTLFKKIVGKDLKDLENNLIKKYRKRGFSQLLPIIIHQFEELRNS